MYIYAVCIYCKPFGILAFEMKCKHNRPRRRRFAVVEYLSFIHPLTLSLFLFQSDYRPRNLIKLRLPSGALAKNQGAFTRQIKRTTPPGTFTPQTPTHTTSYFNNVWI